MIIESKMRVFIFILSALVAVSSAWEDKTEQMLRWQRKRSDWVIKMGQKDFEEYVRQKGKEYSTLVMFTAQSPSRGCQICTEAAEEFSTLAKSTRYTATESNYASMFFVLVDYDEHDGHRIFDTMRLKSAPAVYLFNKDGRTSKNDQFDISSRGYLAETMAQFLTERSGTQFTAYRPPNYRGWWFITLVAVSALAIIYMKLDSIKEHLNRDTIGYICVVASLIFTSGQMWNSIRGPQYLMRARGGGIGFVYPGSNMQLVAETHIVMILYGAATLGAILLIKSAQPKTSLTDRRFFMLLGGSLLFAGYGLTLNVFKRKYRGYPYSFFLG